VFVFAPDGRLLREIFLREQKLDEEHGIQGLAFDGDGLLYVLDRAHDPRVVVIDPASGRQDDYARFRDVPPCAPPARPGDCSATTADSEAVPDYGAFGPDGVGFLADGRTLLLALSAQSPAAGNPTVGGLFTIPRGPDGRPGELRQPWERRPLDQNLSVAPARASRTGPERGGQPAVLPGCCPTTAGKHNGSARPPGHHCPAQGSLYDPRNYT